MLKINIIIYLIYQKKREKNLEEEKRIKEEQKKREEASEKSHLLTTNFINSQLFIISRNLSK